MALPSAWLVGAERQSMEQNQEEARSETLHAALQTENEPWLTEKGKGMHLLAFKCELRQKYIQLLSKHLIYL